MSPTDLCCSSLQPGLILTSSFVLGSRTFKIRSLACCLCRVTLVIPATREILRHEVMFGNSKLYFTCVGHNFDLQIFHLSAPVITSCKTPLIWKITLVTLSCLSKILCFFLEDNNFLHPQHSGCTRPAHSPIMAATAILDDSIVTDIFMLMIPSCLWRFSLIQVIFSQRCCALATGLA